MDELLLEKARQGDTEAFEKLITPLENRIWRVCWHYTGNRENAEDCAQEAMLRIWRGLRSFRGGCAFETWACRIAANCCLDMLRKQKRDRSVALEPLREAGFDPPDPRPGTAEQAEAAETRQRLRESIARLPEEQREALVLTQLEGVDYERAAELLGISAGTLKSRISRAREKLREWMTGERELSGPENVHTDREERERRGRS